MKHKLEFEAVLPQLRAWREQAVTELRLPESHNATLALKRQIDAAINCLEFCQRHQIRPDANVTVLPDTQTLSPLCNYRICEDQETDDREHWIELEINGEPLILYPGDIIVS